MEVDALKGVFLGFQKNGITEHHVYRRLAKKAKWENAQVLDRIAQDELRHYNIWKELSGQNVSPYRWKIFFYTLVGVAVISFLIGLMARRFLGVEI
jgi:hypothetical protein